MGRIFDPDNVFWGVVRKILYLIELSIAWLVCSLPLITIGTSTSALYYAVVKAVRKERSYPLREFWKAWRLNLKKGIALSTILAVVGGMVFSVDLMLGVTFFECKNAVDYIFSVLFLAKDIVLVGVICNIFPLLSRFDTTVLKLLETTVFLCVRHFIRTLLLVVLVIVTVLIIRVESGVLIILPSLCCLLMSFLLEPMYQKYYGEQDVDGSNGIVDTWYVEN